MMMSSSFFWQFVLEEGRQWRPAVALTLLHFFYTRFVFKLGVLADKFSTDSLCGGFVWRKCKEKDGPRVLE
jgi:hypothetical protein